jgi:hypothetical protein
MKGWWIAVKLGSTLAYWYPFARAWGHEPNPEQYYGVMIGKGAPPA